ncbi:hypothetical protein GA0115253_105726 [Streptomyces sp. Termitarium-T10T-6]|nr:hypothetical protein GA0115253_105726 [Streptomyces sp. Termitarium-T10T-6]
MAGHSGDGGVPLLLPADPQLGGDAALRVELGVQLLLEGAVVLGTGLGARGPVAGRGGAQLVGVGEEAAVEGGGALQLLVGADRGELPAVEDGDAVGELEGGAAVGDEEGGPPRHHLFQRLVDLVLDAGVDGGGRVVEEEEPGVGEDGAGEGDALALAAGEGEPVLADGGVVAVRQVGDEPVGLGGAGGRLDLLLGGVGEAVGDVGADGVGEEEAVLGDEPDGGAQGGLGQLADVVAADEDGPVGDVVEAGQQERDGGLAAAGGADDGDGLAGFDGEREPVEYGPVVLVSEGDVVELDPGRGVCGQLLGPVRHGGLGVDELQDAFDTGTGLLPHGQHHGEHPDRPDELGEVRREGDERAEGDLAPGGQPAAEGEHGDLAEGGHGLEGGGVAGVQPDGAQPPGEEPPADLAELPGLLVLLPEPLDDPDPGDGPVDDSGDGGGLALGVPGGGEEAGLGTAGDEPERGGDGEGDEGEREGEPRHDHQGDDEEQHVPDGHREHEQQPLDQLEVAGGPADDLPGGQLVLTLPVEPGDRRVHVRTQIVLDVEGEPAAVVAADVGGDVDEDGRADEQPGPDGERAGVVGDHVVDDHLGDERHEGHDGHAGERGAEGEHDVPPVPPRVPGQPPAPPLLLCARHALPPRPVRSGPIDPVPDRSSGGTNDGGGRISSLRNKWGPFGSTTTAEWRPPLRVAAQRRQATYTGVSIRSDIWIRPM